jgi:hypothetical protein
LAFELETLPPGHLKVCIERASQAELLTLIPAVLCARRPDPALISEHVIEWMRGSGPSASLVSGADEFFTLPIGQETQDDYAQRYVRLAGRILQSNDASLGPTSLARVVITLGSRSNESERRRTTEALQRIPAVLGNPSEFLNSIDERAFIKALGRMPLERGGPRHEFLIALAKGKASILRDLQWWRGFEWSDLEILASGPLNAAVRKLSNLSGMVTRVVDEYVGGITTRAGLAQLLGAPHFVFEKLTPERVAGIIDRVADTDSLMRVWRNVVADEDGRAALKAEADAARDESQRAAVSERRGRADRDEISQELAAVQRTLEAIRGETQGVSARELRQVQIDAAKAIAKILATVDGDAAQLGHSELVKKISSLAEREGVERDAARGAEVDFDPVRHSSPGARPQPREPVVVTRAGYTWNDSGVRIVILPAVVARPSVP